MQMKWLIPLSAATLLTGCETIQTPQQRQQEIARQQASARHMDDRMLRLQGQVESVAMENARLMQEVQQLRNEIRAANGAVNSLEAKQAREMQELISRVEALLNKAVAARPAASSSSKPSRGSGREHVVESGHTLSAIATAYGTTVKAIKDANNLKSDSIYVGQKLFIPE